MVCKIRPSLPTIFSSKVRLEGKSFIIKKGSEPRPPQKEPLKHSIPKQLLEELASCGKTKLLNELLQHLGIPSTSGDRTEKIEAISRGVEWGKFQKSFTKVYKRSGGIARVCCPHGVIYGVKFLTRAEGFLDYIEIVKAMKHAPTVLISDSGAGIAATANKQFPGWLGPNGGKFADSTNTRILEGLNNVPVLEAHLLDLPFLDPDYIYHGILFKDVHPVSGDKSIICTSLLISSICPTMLQRLKDVCMTVTLSNS